MKIKIQTNFFCKSNQWSKRMFKIKEIVKNIIKIQDLDFKKNNFYILNLIFVDDKKKKNINKNYRKKNKTTDVLTFVNCIKNNLNNKNNFILENIDKYGFNGDYIESQAFGYLAIKSFLNLPISFPNTTGCTSPTVGGIVVKNF